jgi:hypothetical protein
LGDQNLRLADTHGLVIMAERKIRSSWSTGSNSPDGSRACNLRVDCRHSALESAGRRSEWIVGKLDIGNVGRMGNVGRRYIQLGPQPLHRTNTRGKFPRTGPNGHNRRQLLKYPGSLDDGA